MEKKDQITEEALKYEKLGFSVIPLGEISKNSAGKKEIQYPIGWKQYQTVRATPDEIRSWNCKNLGIVTGEVSGIFVLDSDLYKKNFDANLLASLNIPKTPRQRTAGGGEQSLLRIPKDFPIKNQVNIGNNSGIDIRGSGGMVICPPSQTPYGKYEWIDSPFDTPIAEAPKELLDYLKLHTRTNAQLSENCGLKEGEGRNDKIASYVGTQILTVQKEKWAEEVWPKVVQLNETFDPPLDRQELEKVYGSITKIESERIQAQLKDSTIRTLYAPSISHTELIGKQFPPVKFTLDPFFEKGTLNMVSAPPNQWKSWLLLYFAARISNGDLSFDKFQTEKSNVMIVNEEDSERSIRDRLEMLGMADKDFPIFYRIAKGFVLNDIFVQNLIREAKEKCVTVIMFDSLRAIHTADENDSTAMQGVMDHLKKIAREEITVVFTHYHRKKAMFQKSGDAESSRGSSAINAAISGHISLEEILRPDRDVIVVSHLKSKVSKKLEPFELAIQRQELGKISFEYLGEKKAKETSLEEVGRKILNLMEDKKDIWFAVKDLVERDIGSKGTIKEALRLLKLDKKVKSMSRMDAVEEGLHIINKEGAHNEKLYSRRGDNEEDDT